MSNTITQFTGFSHNLLSKNESNFIKLPEQALNIIFTLLDTKADIKTFLAIFQKLRKYNKAFDWINNQQIINISSLSKNSVTKSVANLIDKKIIFIRELAGKRYIFLNTEFNKQIIKLIDSGKLFFKDIIGDIKKLYDKVISFIKSSSQTLTSSSQTLTSSSQTLTLQQKLLHNTDIQKNNTTRDIMKDKVNTKEPAALLEINELKKIAEQIKINISEAELAKLLKNYSFEIIKNQMIYLPYRSAANPIGLLIAACKNNYPAPVNYKNLQQIKTQSQSHKSRLIFWEALGFTSNLSGQENDIIKYILENYKSPASENYQAFKSQVNKIFLHIDKNDIRQILSELLSIIRINPFNRHEIKKEIKELGFDIALNNIINTLEEVRYE